MATNSNLKRWLEGMALDESLADHDAKYHGGHFDPKTMSCGKRDSQAKGDDPKLGGAEEKKKPGEAAKGSKDKYDLEYDAVSEEAKIMSDKDLWKIVNDIEDEEWSNNKSEYCEAMGRPSSELDDSRSDFQDDIESSLYGYDPIYTAYKDELERREKSGGAVSAQDAAAKEYLALCQDADSLRSQNSGKSRKLYPYAARKHADGSVCKAASPETCPFNKEAEAAETAITGTESSEEDDEYDDVSDIFEEDGNRAILDSLKLMPGGSQNDYTNMRAIQCLLSGDPWYTPQMFLHCIVHFGKDKYGNDNVEETKAFENLYKRVCEVYPRLKDKKTWHPDYVHLNPISRKKWEENNMMPKLTPY